ncbi:hypothetical protein NBRC116583_06690 [Arenicella sp. 4NH20-0111]|uniref:hypothetical protein n=1 Tax=Arenicella sp. 4NH20-0111 TaxID=3127648 RepID=UPI00310ACE09
MRRLLRLVLSISIVSLLLVGSLAADSAYAKTTSDPNHKGWVGKHPRSKIVQWKPIEAKCEKCTQMVAQYNQTMQQLLNSRYWVNFWISVANNRNKGKKDPFWPGEGDISDFEGKAIGANLELFELQNAQLELHRGLVRTLERQASYLRGVIIECELTACGKAKKPKIKNNKIGGDSIDQPWQPDVSSILTQHDVAWKGPYTSYCLPCKPIITQLNAVPGWIVRAHMKLRILEAQLEYSRMIEKSNAVTLEFLQYTHPDKTNYTNLEAKVAKLKAELIALKKLFEQLLSELSACEQKYCKPETDRQISTTDDHLLIGLPDVCTRPASNMSIIVGPNSEVGSKANFKDKAKKKLAGAAVGALAKLAGLGGGGSNGATGPTTYKDPVKRKYKTKLKSKKPKRELRTGGVFTPDGLLISSDIKKAPGKGTFQTVYLQNANGWRLAPIGIFMYEIWRDWKLSVSWTRDTFVDGDLVKHEEGGWTESWRELIARGEETIFGEVPEAPLWEQLGFTTAVSGARSLGTLFPISPAMLRNQTWNLVIHVTDPKKDPVLTVPYVFELSVNPKGIVVAETVDNTRASRQSECDDALLVKPVDSSINSDASEPIDDVITDLMTTNIATFLYEAEDQQLRSIFETGDLASLERLEQEAFDSLRSDWVEQISDHHSPNQIESALQNAIRQDEFFQSAREFLDYGVVTALDVDVAALYNEAASDELKSIFDQVLLGRDLAQAYAIEVNLEDMRQQLADLIDTRERSNDPTVKNGLSTDIANLENEVLNHDTFIDQIVLQGELALADLSAYQRSLLSSHIIIKNNDHTQALEQDPLAFHSVIKDLYDQSPYTPQPNSPAPDVKSEPNIKDDPEIKKFLEEYNARRQQRLQDVNEALGELEAASIELRDTMESAAKVLLAKPEDVVGYCGPDVTKPFMESLARIHKRMKLVPDNEKGIIDGNQFMLRNGGNTDYWSKYGDWKGTAQCPTLTCGNSDPCFTFKGRCFPLHVFSDITFGFTADQLYLPEFDAKAGGAAHEGSKALKKRKKGHTLKQGWVKGALSILGSVYEDFLPGYRAPMQLKEPEATVSAYKFGDEISEDFDDGKIQSAADISDEHFDALVQGVYASTPGSWPHLKYCQACPDPVPLQPYNNHSKKDWLLSDEKTQTFSINEAGEEVYDIKPTAAKKE